MKNDQIPRHRVARALYQAQAAHCENRYIEFNFTFEEWEKWWIEKLGPDWVKKRGRKGTQYCMARRGDTGDYSLDNVECITASENGKARKKNGATSYGACSNAKLGAKQVMQIFWSKKSIKELALEFGVSPGTIRGVRNREIWKSVTDGLRKR